MLPQCHRDPRCGGPGRHPGPRPPGPRSPGRVRQEGHQRSHHHLRRLQGSRRHRNRAGKTGACNPRETQDRAGRAELPGSDQCRSQILPECNFRDTDARGGQYRLHLPERRPVRGRARLCQGIEYRVLQVHQHGKQGRAQRERAPALPQGRPQDGCHPHVPGGPGRRPGVHVHRPQHHEPSPKPQTHHRS